MGHKPFLIGLICLGFLGLASSVSAQGIEVSGPGVEVRAPGVTVRGPGVTVSGPGVEIGAGYYTPQYYLNYPVFYDDGGRPFYYVGGAVRYVPRGYNRYDFLVGHWHQHRVHYRRWYRARGHRFHHYRRRAAVRGDYAPLYHDGYVVYYDPSGRPYYYVGGRTTYIAAHHPSYRRYRTYYGRHRARYRVWHRRHGHRYRAYRRARPARRVVHGRPYRGAPEPAYRARKRAARRYGAPEPAYRARKRAAGYDPGHRRGRVSCRSNPGHPSCRRGRVPAAAHRRHQRRQERRDRRHQRRDRRHR